MAGHLKTRNKCEFQNLIEDCLSAAVFQWEKMLEIIPDDRAVMF